MGFEVLHRIVDLPVGHRLAYIGILRGRERETGILTEVDSYDWITFLPMSDGMGAYNSFVFTGNNLA